MRPGVARSRTAGTISRTQYEDQQHMDERVVTGVTRLQQMTATRRGRVQDNVRPASWCFHDRFTLPDHL
jgi:hypothetical protein